MCTSRRRARALGVRSGAQNRAGEAPDAIEVDQTLAGVRAREMPALLLQERDLGADCRAAGGRMAESEPPVEEANALAETVQPYPRFRAVTAPVSLDHDSRPLAVSLEHDPNIARAPAADGRERVLDGPIQRELDLAR